MWANTNGRSVVTMQDLLSISAAGTSSAFSLAETNKLLDFWIMALVIDSPAMRACCSNFVVAALPLSSGLLKKN